MGACLGHVLPFGWREQSGFQVGGHATPLNIYHVTFLALLCLISCWTFGGKTHTYFVLTAQRSFSTDPSFEQLHTAFDMFQCSSVFSVLDLPKNGVRSCIFPGPSHVSLPVFGSLLPLPLTPLWTLSRQPCSRVDDPWPNHIPKPFFLAGA